MLEITLIQTMVLSLEISPHLFGDFPGLSIRPLARLLLLLYTPWFFWLRAHHCLSGAL